MYTYNQKNLTFSLAIVSMLLFSGCGPNDTSNKSENYPQTESPKKISVKSKLSEEKNKLSEEEITELEVELETEINALLTNNHYLKLIDPEYNINNNYQQPANLLSVKIVDNNIKIYFGKFEIEDETSIEDFISAMFDSGDNFAIEHKIKNPDVELYFDGKSLTDMSAKYNQEMRDVFSKEQSNK